MNAAGSGHPAPVPWLAEVLETVGDFGSASLGLVAWELSLAELALRPAWEHAIAGGMLERAGHDRETGEQMYRRAAQGGRAR